MEIGQMKAMPPHVRFASKAVENRAKSIEAGHYVADEVHYVYVTPIGSKDCFEKPVVDWFEGLDQQVKEERMPAEWAAKFKDAYEYWKRGEEIPVEGLPIKNWAVATPAEIAACVKLHILTVESLAQANDEAVRRIGMGGLALKQRAKQYLEAATGPGKITAQMEALKQENKTLAERNEALNGRLAQLELLAGVKSPTVTTQPEGAVQI